MKKKAFSIIELLIVVAILGILVGIGGVSIKRQAKSNAMIRIKNELGDFFRVASKRSKETRKKYLVEFKLDENIIKISNEGKPIENIELPNFFEYGVMWKSKYIQNFTVELENYGNLDKNFSLYIFERNNTEEITGNEKLEYVVSFSSDRGIKYLHVREYIPITEINSSQIIKDKKSPSANKNLKLLKD